MRIFFTSLFVCFLYCADCYGQELKIFKGIVADSATYSALPYVTIQVRHTTRGVRSDAEGNFSISATLHDTLVFSFVGYKTIDIPLWDWEPGVILMAQVAFELNTITIQDTRLKDPYENLFDEENARWLKQNKKLPFYYRKGKKEKIKVQRLANENERVSTYVDVVINNEEVKNALMKRHHITEEQYYALLTEFNEANHRAMYYLTHAELLSLLYRFYDARCWKRE
jgi:hypothetical protein